MTFTMAVVSALWLGIQTSISPCPLATNIAAVAFLSRHLAQPRLVLISGILYTIGRTVAYMVLSVLLLGILSQTLQSETVSRWLQHYGLTLLGPFLIIVGMFLLNMLTLPGSFGFQSAALQKLAEHHAVLASGALGFVFALSFCPASAALYFLLLIPLAAAQHSLIALPIWYGLGTALPVIVFAALIVFANQYVSKWFNRLTLIEKIVRRIAGWVFISAGIYYCLTVIYDFQPF